MKWVTRSHVHVDRVACPWLITRFIDSDAEFYYVPPSRIEEVVRETGAIPFDAPGVELGHHEGRCSFESIILKYGLKEPGLLKLACIVHAADTGDGYDQEPVGHGLEAIASGTVCATQTTWKTSNTNSRSMMRYMPGAAFKWPRMPSIGYPRPGGDTHPRHEAA
jgi:hypothetical protein